MDDNSRKQIQKLQSLLGNWEGMMSTWFEPGKAAGEEKNTGIFKPGVNENFVVYEYQSSLDGKRFTGISIFGFDSKAQKFQFAWIDSFHMGESMMFSEGEATENGFSVLGSFVYEGIRWGWRTEIEIKEADQIVITAFNISPEGKEDKALETVYKRIKK